MQQRLMETLRAFIASTPGIGLDVGTEERYVPSTDGIANTNFLRLGLTDATLVAGTPNGVTLLTDDLNLYMAAHRAGRDVEYFTHSLKAAGLL